MRNKLLKLAGFVSVVALLAIPNLASAAGTVAGTTVNNTATLTFSVGGATQPTISGVAPGFVVDRKIDVVVTRQSTNPVNVLVPNSSTNIHTFRVSNLGNGPAGGVADPYGNFIFSNTTPIGGVIAAVDLYSDANGNGTFDAGIDTPIATGATPTVVNIPADGYATVFMVATATNAATLTAANGTTETYRLTAFAATPAGTLLNASATPTTGVDIVFTDGAGPAGPGADAARDGFHSDTGNYTAATAIISVSKSSTVSDPYGTAFAIPGATVTYTITIANTGTASATLASIGDPLDANLTLTGVASWALSSGGGAALVADLADANADGLGFAAGPPVNLTYTIATFLTTANTTVARAVPGELQAGETLTLTFNATIN